MSNIPTINELYSNLINDLSSRLNIDSEASKRVLEAFSASLAGQLKLTYLYLKDISDNIHPDTADSVDIGGTLERIGLIRLNRNRRPARIGTFKISALRCTMVESNSVE